MGACRCESRVALPSADLAHGVSSSATRARWQGWPCVCGICARCALACACQHALHAACAVKFGAHAEDLLRRLLLAPTVSRGRLRHHGPQGRDHMKQPHGRVISRMRCDCMPVLWRLSEIVDLPHWGTVPVKTLHRGLPPVFWDCARSFCPQSTLMQGFLLCAGGSSFIGCACFQVFSCAGSRSIAIQNSIAR
jgi:hypothetical protein